MPGSGLRIVVGVGGGIAAYKACTLVRALVTGGDEVVVVPTESALRFVGAPTFEALSGNPVSSSVFDAVDEVRHVRVGHEADLIVVAPATADLIARLASGRADDLLTATVLVATCPVVLAPAMHTEMWRNPATVDNVATLRRRGVLVLEPATGRLTGPDSGPGRMLEPAAIAELARSVCAGLTLDRSLEGRRLLVTAGGTREDVDPVRFLGNRSSGRQGWALAEVAAHRGAEVELVAAATDDWDTPPNTTLIRVRSARELQREVHERVGSCAALLMAAAVADFRPRREASAKLKKERGGTHSALTSIEMEQNPDVLRGVADWRAARGGGLPVLVGFAAETGDDAASPLEYGKRKFLRKGVDLMMCNEVGKEKVFGRAENAGWLLGRMPASAGGDPGDATAVSVSEIAAASKQVVAGLILDRVAELLAMA